jgi:hypothetical protein
MASEKDKLNRKKLLSEHGLSSDVCEALSDYPCVDLIEKHKRTVFLENIQGPLKQEIVDKIGKENYQKVVAHFSRQTGEIDLHKQKVALEKQLLKDPLKGLNDIETWMVYSDLLQMMNNPLGEYIALLLHLQDDKLSSGQRNEATERLAEISPKKLNGLVPCFFIEELPDRYRLHNVHYEMGLFVVDWSKEHLDGRDTKTQDNWLKWLKGKEWKLPDALLYNAVVFELYHWREHPDPIQRKVIGEFRKLPGNNWTITCTRLEYNPEGKDLVVHNYGYDGKPKIKADLVGPSNVLVDSPEVSDATICAVLGIEDKKMIDTVYTWLSTKKPYIWRLQQKPERKDLRAVVLGRSIDYDRFYVDYIYYVERAFGVAVVGVRDFHRK